jgi:peptide/nickel transport system permease protein
MLRRLQWLYVLERVAGAILLILVTVTIVFILIHLVPGDVALMLAGEEAKPEYLAFIRQKYGLDKPLEVQLLNYLATVMRGDLGFSVAYSRPVLDVILERVPQTLLLSGTSMGISILGGVLIGIYTMRKSNSKISRSVLSVVSIFYSAPLPWLGLIAILVFGYYLKVLPLGGMIDVKTTGGLASILDIIRHLILPVGVLSVFYMPPFVYVTRNSLLGVASEDFVTTARAAGFSERSIFFRHILRNGILPVVTLVGLRIGTIFMGAVITETMFLYPGLGRLTVEAISFRDYALVQGIFIFSSTFCFVVSLIVDILYLYLDPRVTFQ